MLFLEMKKTLLKFHDTFYLGLIFNCQSKANSNRSNPITILFY